LKAQVGNLVRLTTVPAGSYEKFVGQVGLVVRVSPNGANLTVEMLDGGYIGLLARNWFEVVS